ncbi:MAG: hypothetical protein ACRDT7_09300 [Microbacterium sp.]
MVVSRSTVAGAPPLFGAEARSDVTICTDARRRSEATHGDGLTALGLPQRAHAPRAQDLDPARMALAADAVDRDAPLRLASAGLVPVVAAVVALAPLPFAVDARELVDAQELIDIAFGVHGRGFLCSHH